MRRDLCGLGVTIGWRTDIHTVTQRLVSPFPFLFAQTDGPKAKRTGHEPRAQFKVPWKGPTPLGSQLSRKPRAEELSDGVWLSCQRQRIGCCEKRLCMNA